MKQKIIIDTDPGIDDALALALAFRSSELEILGLTTIFGNASIATCTANALHLLHLLGKTHVPVAQGAGNSLNTSFTLPHLLVHGKDGLGDIHPTFCATNSCSLSAHDFIIQKVLEFPEEITLLTLGPLTNLALALKKAPSISQKFKKVICMGGAILVNGNITPVAEANIFHDPEASDLVFSAGLPLTLVGLDVTTQVISHSAFFEKLKTSTDPLHHFLEKSFRHYRKIYQQLYPQLDGIYQHDPTALMAVLYPEFFEHLEGPVRVATQGDFRGLTYMSRRKNASRQNNAWENISPIKGCVGVDANKVLNKIESLLF